jgi:hypothetical protein
MRTSASNCVYLELMRRLAVTTFAVLYGVLILAGSAAKASGWAHKQADNVSHHITTRGAHAFHKTERSESHLGQTKITETEHVVESPEQTATAALTTTRQALRWSADIPLFRAADQTPSRAPPFLG